MRTLYFLLPGTGGKYVCGGLFAEMKAMELAQQVCEAAIVTYRQREKDVLFLDDVLQQSNLNDVIFVISWGFDVPKLATRLKGQNVVYHAHSAEYGFSLPSRIPIITVSRNTLGYWGQRAPQSLLYYLPNQISDEFEDRGASRDIDVLVQARKSSRYLLYDLIPELKKHCTVSVVDSFVDDLASLFNRATVYLYDSAEYWALQSVTEGFGLQPMEAIACGCSVFSSVNHGLSDYLDPGFNCAKIAGYSRDFDVQRILATVQERREGRSPSLANTAPNHSPDLDSLLRPHRAEAIRQRWQVILPELNAFFDHLGRSPQPIPEWTPWRLAAWRAEGAIAKLRKKLKR